MPSATELSDSRRVFSIHGEALPPPARRLIIGSKRQLLEQAIAAINGNECLLAIEICQQLITRYPTLADAHHILGVAQMNLKQWSAAESAIQQAITLQGDVAMYYQNLGNVYFRWQRLEQAEVQMHRVLELDAQQPNALSLLGRIQDKLHKKQLAIDYYQAALKLDANAGSIWDNLGVSHYDLGNIQEAIACFRRALQLDPAQRGASCNLAHALLMDGQFAEGWSLYEHREMTIPELPYRRWQGEPLNGRTLCLAGEQGLGDKLQFCRYAQYLKERYPHVQIVLTCPASLKRILSTAPGVDRLVANYSEVGAADYWLPLMSLPHVLQHHSVTQFPNTVPYLSADSERSLRWQAVLSKFPGLKIGVCWQGNRHNSKDSLRSFPLAEVAPLTEVPGVSLISLQVGEGAEQVRHAPASWSLQQLDSTLDREAAFIDTAAIMMHLDLIITCDSAIGHLAGGLGRPVWIALGHCADWRWHKQGDGSAWYPTARLFRQASFDHWPSVFRAMAEALKDLVNSPPGPRHWTPIPSGPPAPTVREILESGIADQSAGRFTQAREHYTHALAIAPQNPDAHHLLAILLHQLGEKEAALMAVRRALELAPQQALFWVTLGKFHVAYEAATEAIEAYTRATRCDPSQAETWMLLGKVYNQLNQLQAAEDAYRRAVQCDQQSHDLKLKLVTAIASRALSELHSSSTQLSAQEIDGLLQDAWQLFQQLLPAAVAIDWQALLQAAQIAQQLQHHPVAAELFLNLIAQSADQCQPAWIAMAMHSLRQTSSTVQIAAKLEELTTAALPAHSHQYLIRELAELKQVIGLEHFNRGEFLEAEKWFRQSQQLCPNEARYAGNLGLSLSKLKRFKDALPWLVRATHLDPRLTSCWINRGYVLNQLWRQGEAIASLSRALKLEPDNACALDNLGVILQDLGQPAEAANYFRAALRIEPTNPHLHVHLGLAEMTLGRFSSGWPFYEARHQLVQYPESASLPTWRGPEHRVQKLLLRFEQGIGDLIQFVRYAQRLKEILNCQIGLLCPQRLHFILSRTPGIDQLLAPKSDISHYDAWIPMMSIPWLVGETETGEFYWPGPYIHSPQAANTSNTNSSNTNPLSAVASAANQPRPLRIGLAWQGNPNLDKDIFRSFPLKMLQPLSQPGLVEFVCLQSGRGREQISDNTFPVECPELAEHDHAFSTTAAVIAQLDFVIACDSAVAHLAGAMGKETWLAVPTAVDWRWGMSGTNSRWYPYHRIFRQAKLGNWSDVVQQMEQALTTKLNAHLANAPGHDR